jgi:hypothetical protein
LAASLSSRHSLRIARRGIHVASSTLRWGIRVTQSTHFLAPNRHRPLLPQQVPRSRKSAVDGRVHKFAPNPDDLCR